MMGHMFNGGFYGDNWDTMPDYMKQMMQNYWVGTKPFLALGGILEFVTHILLIVLLIAAIRWLWKKGDKV